MKKYIAIAKIAFKAQLIYRFDVFMTGLSILWRVAFAWILWGAIFEGRDEVGGFTFHSMLSYYVITAFLSIIDMSGNTSLDLSVRIRKGEFSKFMVIPCNPQFHFLSQTFGSSGYYAIFSVLAAVVSTLIFRINLIWTADPSKLLLAVAMFLLGIVFMNSFHFFVGLWTFKFQDIGFMLYVLTNIILFFNGGLIPLSLLPDSLVWGLSFLPFTYVIYTPAMLLTDRMVLSEGLIGLAILCAWALVMMAVNQLTYKRLRTKYEGVGI